MSVAPEIALFEQYKSRIGEVIGVSDWTIGTTCTMIRHGPSCGLAAPSPTPCM